MSFKGSFEWFNSTRQGGMRAISFRLTCDNLFQDETFDCAIISGDGTVQPMIFRKLTLPAKKSFLFNYDTIDWQWCNGDRFVILGKNDSIKGEWPLQIQTYPPGECPECHGTHRCRKCSGKGIVNAGNYLIEKCGVCHGTGVCQTCYVPERKTPTPQPNEPTTNNGPSSQNNRQARERQIAMLRDQIADLQSKISKTEWDIRMCQLKDWDRDHSSVYLEYDRLLHFYRIQLFNYQSKLRQLEQMQ